MELDEREIADLAKFFAKRFPSFEERAALAESAGLAAEVQLTGDAGAAWADVGREAARRRRLVARVERALQRRPDDANLVDMLRVFSSGKRWRSRRLGLLLVFAALPLLLLGGWLALAPSSPLPGEEEQGALPAAGSSSESDEASAALAEGLPGREGEGSQSAAPSDEAQAERTQDEPTEEEGLVAEAEPGEGSVPSEATAPAPESRRTPPPTSAVTEAARGERPRGCTGDQGQVLGYWYAGEQRPGAVGDVHVVDGGVNVRLRYPCTENGWNARDTLVCSLGHGQRVRISREPIHVNGGAWWVPLSGGDLLER